LRNQVYLGSEEFIEKIQMHIDTDQQLSEIPAPQRRPVPRSLGYYKQYYRTRSVAIIEAYQSGGYTLKQIGDYFGLHYSTVSGIIRHHKSKT
jgi:DNA-binding MarR family transcriptional regulator